MTAAAPHTSLWAREMLASVWLPAWGDRAAREAGILAIARLETAYARWDTHCGDSNNWGAIQTKGPGCEHEDTHADGKKYKANFQIWPSPEAGLVGFVEFLRARPGIWAALASANATVLATAMRRAGYYEGTGLTQATRIERYERALVTASAATAKQLGDPRLALAKMGGSIAAGVALVVSGAASVAAWLWCERRTERRAA